MAKHIFSECELISQKNKKNPTNYKELITLLNFQKVIIEEKQKVSKCTPKKKFKFRERFSHCKDCGDVLKHPHSRVWGLCPHCDML